MSKAKRLLMELLSKIENDFSFSTKIGSYGIGLLTLDNSNDTGTVEIELPLDNIDPDSNTLIVPIYFTYDVDEEGDARVSIKIDIKQYYASDDGKLKDLSKDAIDKVLNLVKPNKPKMENDLARVIEQELAEYYRNR